MSKGSTRRPAAVPDVQVAANFERTFSAAAPHREAEASGTREEWRAAAEHLKQLEWEATYSPPQSAERREAQERENVARRLLAHQIASNPALLVDLLAASPPTGADSALREALRTVRDDFDHDEDAHRYGTTCRVCLAIVALNEVGRFRESWDDRARAALAPRPTPAPEGTE